MDWRRQSGAGAGCLGDDQLSSHALAEALVHGAVGRGLDGECPEEVIEEPGRGIEGSVGWDRVAVGAVDHMAATAWLLGNGCS